MSYEALQALQVVNALLVALGSATNLLGKSKEYRDLVAKAAAEGRQISPAELEELRIRAQNAVEGL